MSTAERATSPPAETGYPFLSWLERYGGLGGLAFVASFLIFAILYAHPGINNSNVVDYGVLHGSRAIWAFIALLFGGFGLLWFVGGLTHRLRRIGDGGLALVGLVSGGAAAGLWLMATVLWLFPSSMLVFSHNYTLAPPLGRVLSDIGYLTNAAAMVAAGALIITSSLGAVGSRWASAPLGWLSVAYGILLTLVAASVIGAFVATIGFVIWVAIASAFVLLEREGTVLTRRF